MFFILKWKIHTRSFLFLTLLFTTFFLYGKSYSIPTFAREYQVDCIACHTNIPQLNEVGERFLRNGFRFSKNDIVLFQEFIKSEEKKRFEPISIMVGFSYADKDNAGNLSMGTKLYLAGTITDTLSLFASTKQDFNYKGENVINMFKEQSSIFYIQFAPDEPTHLFRLGLMSPLTEFGNIQKSFADSGLVGIRLKPSGGIYKTPLQSAGVSNIKGIEYSIMPTDKFMFLISAGKLTIQPGGTQTTSITTTTTSKKNKSLLTNILEENPDWDNYQILTGVKFLSGTGYSLSFILNKNKNNGTENNSYLLSFERNVFPIYLTSVIAYVDNDKKDNYYGIQNAITYAITQNDYIRTIISIGKYEAKDTDYGYSLLYSKIFKILGFTSIFHFVISYVDPAYSQNDTFVKTSINFSF